MPSIGVIQSQQHGSLQPLSEPIIFERFLRGVTWSRPDSVLTAVTWHGLPTDLEILARQETVVIRTNHATHEYHNNDDQDDPESRAYFPDLRELWIQHRNDHPRYVWKTREHNQKPKQG